MAGKTNPKEEPVSEAAPRIGWHIDKESRVPLYLQLEELVRYYVATGVISEQQQLPTVSELAALLGINFETVRRAYKDLEAEGLIEMSRGRGTFALHPRGGTAPADLLAKTKQFLAEILHSGAGVETVRSVVNQALHELSTETAVIFTECNELQVEELSAVLSQQLGCAVKGVLIENLAAETERGLKRGTVSSVITTGFHLNEVRKALDGMPVNVDFVITNMAPDTRRRLEAFDRSARFGFVCRDAQSIPFYRGILASELSLASEIDCATAADLGDLLSRVDVVLCSPPAFRAVRAAAPPELPVFNIFDRVDPVSLIAIKERFAARH